MNLNGILLLDKTSGMTSNVALQRAKRLFGAKKAGHTGTLDPLATGMLPLCFGEATKWSQFLLEVDKCYVVTGLLGSKTDTGDSTGNIVEQKPVPKLKTSDLEAVLSLFRGDIQQIPPMYSALKHKGRPLYVYARAGEQIARKARWVSIKALKLLTFTDNSFTLEVVCSKGTYIRTLVEDIGDILRCGAHVTALRRLYTQSFKDDKMYTLEALEAMEPEARQALLLPMDIMLGAYNKITLSKLEIQKLYYGQLVSLEGDTAQGLCTLYDESKNLVGMGIVYKEEDNILLKAQRLLQV